MPTGTGRVKTREVTREDIQNAALVGQIVAESDLANTDVICAVDDDDCCGAVPSNLTAGVVCRLFLAGASF